MSVHSFAVALCIEGIEAEMAGRLEDAWTLYRRAWSSRTDAYDACVAAHYLARATETPEETLSWNLEALTRATAVGDDRIRGFLPSLHLNLGHSYEMIGDISDARAQYELAAARLDDVGAGAYGDVVRQGVAAALVRVSSATC
jgi:hypothetical protein